MKNFESSDACLLTERSFRLPLPSSTRSSCVFSLTLHYIEHLPATYNGRRVAVNWMRKENYVDSKPATVSDGFADFEEILHLKCTMYGGKGGTKYLPKSSTLSVQAVDGDRAVLGRHKLDLSRLLPSGDITGVRRGSGGGLDGSTVSFPLSVGSLLVTFGYKVSCRAQAYHVKAELAVGGP